MSVSVGFDDDHHFGGRDMRANRFEIIAKMRQVDFDVRRAQVFAVSNGRLVNLHGGDYKGF